MEDWWLQMRMDPLCTRESCSACAEILDPSSCAPKKEKTCLLWQIFSLQPGSSSKAAAPTQHRKATARSFAKRQVSNSVHPVRSSLHLLTLYPESSFLPPLFLFYSRISPRTFFFFFSDWQRKGLKNPRGEVRGMKYAESEPSSPSHGCPHSHSNEREETKGH